jgi:hypothetical protein
LHLPVLDFDRLSPLGVPETHVMAQNAVERLKPFDETITDAVDHYVAYLEEIIRSAGP